MTGDLRAIASRVAVCTQGSNLARSFTKAPQASAPVTDQFAPPLGLVTWRDGEESNLARPLAYSYPLPKPRYSRRAHRVTWAAQCWHPVKLTPSNTKAPTHRPTSTRGEHCGRRGSSTDPGERSFQHFLIFYGKSGDRALTVHCSAYPGITADHSVELLFIPGFAELNHSLILNSHRSGYLRN